MKVRWPGYGLARFPVPFKEPVLFLLLLALIIPYQGMLQARITISIVPCVVVYLLLQRYFVSGLLTGAVK
jgi:ABC-type glycerol-3-phosphate transport system permease component